MASVTSFSSLSGKACAKSARVSSGNSVGVLSRRIYRPEDVRARMADQWSAWCRANFRNSVHLAQAFDVSEKTARLWLEGVNAPQGYAVACAEEGLIEGAAPFRLELAA